MKPQSTRDQFYIRLTKIWFGLLFFNVILNIYPYFQDTSSEQAPTAHVVQKDEICAPASLFAGQQGCPYEILSAVSVSVVTSAKPIEKYQVALPSRALSFQVMAMANNFWQTVRESVFHYLTSFICDRGPPRA